MIAATARLRLVGAVVLAALTALAAVRAPWTEPLQTAWFDLQQSLWPRRPDTLPVTIVEIDAPSLQALGPWPWPRTRLAQLIDAVAAGGPAAVGLTLLMPEPDTLSPERLLGQTTVFDEPLVQALRALPSNDAALADAVRRARVVLAVGGLKARSGAALRGAPVNVREGGAASGLPPALLHFGGAQTSLDVFDREAGGWGLASLDTTGGSVHRMPLVARVADRLLPSLAVEVLRVAAEATDVGLEVEAGSARAVQVGSLRVATEPDGAVRPYFSTSRAERFVSAVTVLQARLEPTALRGQLVLIAPTAPEIEDALDTPVGQRMAPVEVHAQLIENLMTDTLLRRPSWAPALEAAFVLVLGAVLLWATPRWRPYWSATLALALAAVPIGTAALMFRGPHQLLDAATPALHLALFFLALQLISLTDSMRQRRALEARLQTEREQTARLEGELDAARRIQTSMLPRLEALADDARIDVHARLTPAREVGGDLYDVFRLDRDRLFVLVGDVAGKGLSASIFMAVSKALYKAAVLRAPDADLGALMRAANLEVSRDNATQLFVTAFAALLDLRSGEIEYCNAGHDDPVVLTPQGDGLLRLRGGDGPPLCAADDFPYRSASHRLAPGQMVVVVTDGAAEARGASGELFGWPRLEAQLLHLQSQTVDARAAVDALHAAVQAFAAGAEPADDLTLLALRWRGPAPRS